MKYVKIPGQINDLMKLFGYHFNKSALDRIIENPEEYEQTHLSVLNGEQINDDLYVFFYSAEGTNNFTAQKVFADTKNDFLSEDLFGIVCQRLKSSDLFGELLTYYMNEYSQNSKNELGQVSTLSPEQIYTLIKNTDIPDKIKLQLVHFSINKSYYSNLLISELEKKFALIERFFQKSKIKIEYAQRLIEAEGPNSDIFTALGIVPEPGEIIYCSVSSTEDKMAIMYNNETYRCLVIGYETIDKVQELLGSRAFDMFLVAKALADTLRISIINMVKDRGEMNTTEIANTFGKGLTAVFYHLNMLAEAKILNTRSRGRTVLYSVNSELFNNFSVFVKDFAVNRAARL